VAVTIDPHLEDPLQEPDQGRRTPLPLAIAMAATALIALVGRFFITTPLWLDEALSVNLAKLPIGDIGAALRHDGHPPLYYWMLHGWISMFGDGTRAVRSLSAVISLLALPLAYLIGRRLGGRHLGVMFAWVLAVSPFLLRYGSETRMYSLVIVEVMVGYLVVDTALRKIAWAPLLGVAVTTCALLWTHYWSLWLLIAIGLLLVIRVVRSGRQGSFDRPALAVLGAMAVGAVGYLPWVPSMLYQAQHTGTPWAKTARPAGILVTSVFDFSGGPYSEPQVGAFFSMVILVIGLLGAARVGEPWHLDLDFRTRRDARPIGAIVGATVIVASIATLVLRSGFAARYASVYFPFVVLLVAFGLERFLPGRLRTLVLSTFLVLTVLGLGFTFRQDRTQAGIAAEHITSARQSNPLVVTCPDQLGPAVSRALGPDTEVVTYPALGSPALVDWVDYERRNAATDPVAFADAVLKRAGDRSIFLVFGTGYLTMEGKCEGVIARLGQSRPGRILLTNDANAYYENMSVLEYPGAPS
jgi:mannosyltransferase